MTFVNGHRSDEREVLEELFAQLGIAGGEAKEEAALQEVGLLLFRRLWVHVDVIDQLS